MPINPVLQELIRQLPVDLPRTLTPELIQEIRITRVPLPEEMRQPIWKKEDQVIPGPYGEIPIRIYTPFEKKELYSAIVTYHGGGWTLGNIESHDGAFRHLSNSTGCKVISVDYRLAPEYRFPVGVEDCYTALEWVFNHAEALQIDENRIAVAGDSAGGNLSAALTLMARDRNGPNIWKQVLFYPATDALRLIEESPYESIHVNADAPLLTTSVTKSFWDHYLSSEEDADNPYCSPIRAKDLRHLPPAFVITAEYDPIRDEGELYGKRLQESGVPVRMKRVEGAVHGFITIPMPMTDEIMEDVADFLNE